MNKNNGYANELRFRDMKKAIRTNCFQNDIEQHQTKQPQNKTAMDKGFISQSLELQKSRQ